MALVCCTATADPRPMVSTIVAQEEKLRSNYGVPRSELEGSVAMLAITHIPKKQKDDLGKTKRDLRPALIG